jgi:hypothetical protein
VPSDLDPTSTLQLTGELLLYPTVTLPSALTPLAYVLVPGKMAIPAKVHLKAPEEESPTMTLPSDEIP